MSDAPPRLLWGDDLVAAEAAEGEGEGEKKKGWFKRLIG